MAISLPNQRIGRAVRGRWPRPCARLRAGSSASHPALDQLALERAEMVDEELPLQVVHLVLHADGEQRVRGFLLLPFAVAVGVLDDDVAEAGDVLVLVGDGEAPFG